MRAQLGRVGRVGRVGLVAMSVLALSALLSAKRITTRITIEGPTLTAPVEITDAHILEQFIVWAGPGVFHTVGAFNNRQGPCVGNCGEETEGFIIDWSAGVVAERPAGLQRFDVSFYVDSSAQPAYQVLHEYDAAAGQSYIYLPGPRDEWYQRNSRAMFHGHGLEGHWFHATAAWQQVVTPLIAKAR